ncbi:DNA methyltransferase [Spiroplasma attinicola]|uniref:DNA methyltransferase n=1 Tax=Spiroplasma attinicola TaxID=2904537 RepID=UPI002022A8E8|nr:DNA methyltransferase [Spiroplasma sp. JKS002670]MCL8209624.1 hypothetical protein [Spiroplasma sp. JKS002670]
MNENKKINFEIKSHNIDDVEGKYDVRNKLNDLTGKEWLKLTRSFWFSETSKIDKSSFKHPAPFMVADISKLIKLFTKKNMLILDPFVGSGTTLIASLLEFRNCIGIDLNEQYKNIFLDRYNEVFTNLDKLIYKKINFEYKIGDSNLKLNEIENLSIDYIVTSPPYHNILKNNGSGLRKISKNGYRSGSRVGVEYYSNDENDLGNLDSYSEFLYKFKEIMKKSYEKLKFNKYCSIIISDFTVNKREISVHSDIIKVMLDIGFEFSGTIVLLQDKKPLYPFGYPYQYKINHHHQNIINFRKNLKI